MAYDLIVGEVSLHETIEMMLSDREKVIIFPFDPHNITNQDIEYLIEYYVEQEDYVKCAKLKKCLTNKNL